MHTVLALDQTITVSSGSIRHSYRPKRCQPLQEVRVATRLVSGAETDVTFAAFPLDGSRQL